MGQRVKYSDTSSMLVAYRTGVLFAADTTSFLNAYQFAINCRLRIADTTSMLSAYATGLNAKLKWTDTATLFTDYRTAINARIKYSDSISLLSAYQSAINSRLKISDTTAMLAPYIISLNAKVKYTDTSSMLSPYITSLNTKVKYTDTAAMFSAYRALIDGKVKYTDTSAMLGAYITSLNTKIKYSDSATMLSAYQTAINAKQASLGFTAVPNTRTVNGYALSSNITLLNTDIAEDGTHRWTTDAEKTTWNAKQSAITTGTTAQYFRGDFSLATFPTSNSSFTNGAGYLVAADIAGKANTSHTHVQVDVTNLVTDLSNKQPLDADLTTIAALSTAANDVIMQVKSNAWSARTPAQFKTDLVLVKGDVGLGNVDNTSDVNKPVSTSQQTALDGKQNLDADLTTIASLTPTTDNFIIAAASAWASRTPAQAKTSLALVKADVGLGSVDNTSDVGKPVSTATQTALDLKANLASPAFTGTPTLPTGTIGTTQSAGNNTTALATTAFVTSAVPNASYRTILQASGSHTAAKVAGTYAMGDGDPIAVSGTGTLYPIKTIYIASADYPSVNGLAPKLRIRAQLYTNDVAPTGNYTFGLYPITRPATSGGAGLNIYTLGTVISGSNGATFTTPAADGLLNAAGSDFALPADGHYVLGVVTTATVAASAHVHMVAVLQMRNN